MEHQLAEIESIAFPCEPRHQLGGIGGTSSDDGELHGRETWAEEGEPVIGISLGTQTRRLLHASYTAVKRGHSALLTLVSLTRCRRHDHFAATKLWPHDRV